jgi:hypothetical protein
MKLYKVNLQNYGRYGEHYVAATDPTHAYYIVRRFMDNENLCFAEERELKSIELVAKQGRYSTKRIPLLHVEPMEAEHEQIR